MDPVTIAGVGLGLVKTIDGFVQAGKGKEIEKRNIRPDYEIPEEYKEIVNRYKMMAQGGFGDETLSKLNNKALQGLSASLSTGLRLGAGPNAVGDYYSRYLDNADDIAIKDTQLQFENINRLSGAQKDLADQKIIEFGYDKDAPYKDKAQQASLLKKQGYENIMGGMDYALGSVISGQSRDLYQSYIDKMSPGGGTAKPSVIGNVVGAGVSGGAAGATSGRAVPTSMSTAPNVGTDDFESWLNSLPADERQMILNGYF